jgi:hypothetical protein
MILGFTPGGRAALAHSLTLAADHLDQVLATLTPDASNPAKPVLDWGNDLGVFEHLNWAANALDRGRDGVSEVFTHRQAGRVIDAIAGDVPAIQALRDAALAIDEGGPLKGKAPAPSLGADALAQVARAAADARAAVALLTGAA